MTNFWEKLNKPNTFLRAIKAGSKVLSTPFNVSTKKESFWKKLGKPIFILAPMEDVTDVVFREMFAKYSKVPHTGVVPSNDLVMYTEFVNVDGLLHPEGYKKLSIDLKYTEAQRPMVGQIWGTNPEKFYEAAKLLANLGFDGIDINMGCPQDKEIGIGACAALIRNPELAKEIIEATKKGAGDLPVSVKTRIGYSKPETEKWIGFLLEQNLAVIAVHGRTKQEKSKVPAHWDEIKKAVEVRNKLQATRDKQDKTLIIGNGDIKSKQEALQRIEETGVDGVMVGRGAFGSPWFFRNDGAEISVSERLNAMVEHAENFEKEFSGLKSFYIMRKHFKAYASGFPGSAELRAKLMEAENLEQTKKIVDEYIESIK